MTKKSIQLDTISDTEKFLHALKIDSSSFFKKHDHRCYFCDFRDLQFLEVHHLDCNHNNNNESNLVPACTLCHRAHHLAWVLTDRAGLLGICHDLDQVRINHLQRFVLVLANHPDPKLKAFFTKGGMFQTVLDNIAMEYFRPDVDEKTIRDSIDSEFPQATIDLKESLFTDRVNAIYVRQSLSSNDGLERLIYAINDVKQSNKTIAPNAFFPFVLLYNQNIFTKEQIDYYLSLDEFNPDKWTQLFEEQLLKAG
jgi:HNH endonuclease.